MEIHIDTKKDSDEEIRKAIRMLQAYVGDNISGSSSELSSQVSGFSSQNSEMMNPSPGAFNIFGDGGGSNDRGSEDNLDLNSQSFDSNSDSKIQKKEDLPRIEFIDY
ncbi:hypothetical protein K9L67_02555 [Candidatus Woesearchaeota archaeon]|nr:hypothetical protein [Candidatus Woesearchaeota archaeon]MCF7901086.1 hypothetical protein [Candidatus Woesearchaeota archaeon]MCF8013419.1 hypothetical protein [Candidatus Woesearchaeota archaeon]